MKLYDVSHPVLSLLLCLIINFVFVLEIIFLMNFIHLYYLNWSFFPGIFLLHISSKPMCGCRHSIEMQVTSYHFTVETISSFIVDLTVLILCLDHFIYI